MTNILSIFTADFIGAALLLGIPCIIILTAPAILIGKWLQERLHHRRWIKAITYDLEIMQAYCAYHAEDNVILAYNTKKEKLINEINELATDNQNPCVLYEIKVANSIAIRKKQIDLLRLNQHGAKHEKVRYKLYCNLAELVKKYKVTLENEIQYNWIFTTEETAK